MVSGGGDAFEKLRLGMSACLTLSNNSGKRAGDPLRLPRPDACLVGCWERMDMYTRLHWEETWVLVSSSSHISPHAFPPLIAVDFSFSSHYDKP